ncbi:MAG: glycosyltransferase family 1 [Rariglobus sp.]|jgi:hypothetical protein|nr:glycosyltransferase family 1 [Rariglobus sp.]
MNLKTLKRLGHLAILATAFSVTTATAQTTWYLLRNQANSENFNTVSLWNSNSAGTGTAATGMDPTAIYDTNGKAVRSPSATGGVTSTFSGGLLLLNHSEFSLKTTTNNDVANLATAATGADILNANPTSAVKLRVSGTFTVNGNTGIFSTAADRSIALEVGTLTGSGDLFIGGTRQINGATSQFASASITATNALNYTGDIVLGSSTVATNNLSFGSNFSSGGSLKLSTGTTLKLAHNLSFAGGLFLDNQLIALSAGTYDYAALVAANASLGSVLTDLGGHLIVSAIPEPSTFAAIAGFSVLLLGLMVRRRAR